MLCLSYGVFLLQKTAEQFSPVAEKRRSVQKSPRVKLIASLTINFRESSIVPELILDDFGDHFFLRLSPVSQNRRSYAMYSHFHTSHASHFTTPAPCALRRLCQPGPSAEEAADCARRGTEPSLISTVISVVTVAGGDRQKNGELQL